MVSNALRQYGTVASDQVSTATPGPSAASTEGGSTRLAVDVRRFGWIRPLAGDYAFDFDKVASLYAGNPRSPGAWRDAIARTRLAQRDREGIAAAVAAQQARRAAPPAAREAAAKLTSPDTVAVVTGQQAGVFGGPLFTLLKAITAIQLARRAASDHQAEVVTIFWVDAEDHDWEEVASCTVLDAGFQARTVSIPRPDGAGDLPVAALRLDSRIEQSIQELSGVLPPTDFTESTIAGLRAAYTFGTGMAEAFARWLETTLGPYGLIVFESSDPAAKPFVAEIFTRELETPGLTASLAAAAGEAFASLGHQPQVIPHPDSVSLFHLDGARRPIRRQDDRFVVGDRTCTIEELRGEAARSPSRFSPNVLLRSIVQDALFPTICYVAGPSELAYLGQLKDAYEHFGVPMPLMYPRASATLIDSAAARFLRRYELPLEALQPQDESVLNRMLASQLPASVEQALKETQETIHRGMERLIDAMPALDPTLAGAARTTLGRMDHDLRGLHSKMIQAAKRRDETLRRQFTRTQAQIFPLGHPQERTLGVIYFLNQYGPALVERLMQELPLDLGRHWVMTI
ncbi:MAG TPA: bacillithiol biosynthesis cysteine-adding enzyme BshC [Vicinamibacterales bacterium]|nr:bacillithiol biosynthesis cysteine-adding enzyme BshC [Vicinamibacterales bacterium]